MEMVEHILTLRGPNVSGGRPRPHALGQLLRFIDPAVRESISMGFRNTSAVRGRRPAWFERATDIRLVDVAGGEDETTLLYFEAPRFGSAAEEFYRQKQLFEGSRPSEADTGFDLLSDVLADIRGRNADSLRFDAGLLRKVSQFEDYPTKSGIQSVAIAGDRFPADAPAILDAAVSRQAEEMLRSTPPACRARIAGKLDMIRDHDNVFELLLAGGTPVRGVWPDEDMSALRDLFGQDVLVEGEAVFRVSGNLLRIDASAARTATNEDSFFRRLPAPTSQRTEPRSFLRSQASGTGATAIYGRWPGDESEEAILAALRESRG